MASGTIELTRNPTGQFLIGQIVWSSTSNGTAANNSTVTADLQLQRNALNTTTGTFKGTFTVGSTSQTISWYGSLPSQTWVTIATIAATVNHNANGAGSSYLYAKVNGPTGTTMEGTYVSGSQTVTLDTIPRYASIASATDFTDEDATGPTITYSNPAGASVEYLQACISLDGSRDDVPYRDIPKAGSSYTFALTESERNTLRAASPNSNYLDVEVYVRSSIGGISKNRSVPSRMTIVSADPIISPRLVDTNSATTKLTGNSSILVAFHSTAQVTMNASAQKYATINSRKVEHGTATLTGDGTLSVTNNPIKFTVVDSRGNKTEQYASNTIVPYINPTCLIGNNIPETDGSLRLVVTGLFFDGSFGKTTNALTVQYRYKAAGGNYPEQWTTFGSVTKSGNGYTATANITGLDYRTTYTFQARVIDSIHASGVASAERAVVSQPVFDWGQNDFSFNVPVSMRKGATSVRLTAQDDLNDVTANGWYDWLSGNTPANSPSGTATGSIYSMRVFSRGYACIQECCDTTTNRGCVIQRTLNDDGATPWEWVNPPMLVGYEFRTTERYNGKPVYMRLVNFGALPANSTKSVTVSGMYYPFSIVGTTSGNRSIPHAGHITVRGSSQSIEVATTADYSSTTATLIVKYLKEAP